MLDRGFLLGAIDKDFFQRIDDPDEVAFLEEGMEYGYVDDCLRRRFNERFRKYDGYVRILWVEVVDIWKGVK